MQKAQPQHMLLLQAQILHSSSYKQFSVCGHQERFLSQRADLEYPEHLEHLYLCQTYHAGSKL